MGSTAAPVFHGLDDLCAADPLDVAAQLFVRSFGPVAHKPLPQIERSVTYDSLAGLGGYQLPSVMIRIEEPYASTIQIALEACLIWERAMVASRLSSGRGTFTHTLTMLRAGRRLLDAGDPSHELRLLLKS